MSIQYHALKAASHYDQYFKDAEGRPDVQEFIREIQQQDYERAQRCHQLLGQLAGRAGMDARS